MSDQQDRSSACSEFEPIYGIPQIEEQLLDGEMPQPNVDNTMEEYDQSNSDNGDGGGRTFSSADDTDLAAMHMHIIDQLKLKLALANAQKENAAFKTKMLEMRKKIEQLETGEGRGGRVVEEKVAEFVEAKLTAKLTQFKEIIMEEAKQLIVPINNALHIFKGDVDNRLEQLLNENGTRLQKLLEEERLKEWLATGMGQLRNVILLRVLANQLVTSGSWNIQPNSGGLKANKTAATWAHVRAIQPHPVATARHEDKLLFYFEATITGNAHNTNLHIGLCSPNFDFTLCNIVGNVTGSFAMRLDGTYFASGTSQSGFGKGAFANGDVVGCGLLVLPTERRLFFAKNGEIWVKPILLGSEDAKENLYPTVSAYDPSAEVVFNFGADLAAKPFKYELSQLDVVDA